MVSPCLPLTKAIRQIINDIITIQTAIPKSNSTLYTPVFSNIEFDTASGNLKISTSICCKNIDNPKLPLNIDIMILSILICKGGDEMKRIIIKPYLTNMMKQNFPSYELTRSQGMFYVFRRKEMDDLYSYIVFQREESPYNQLMITECGVGYNKNWNGHPGSLIGYGNSLGAIMAKSQSYSDICWVVYGDNEESIAKCMDQLKFQFNHYIHPFLKKAQEKTLANDLMKSTKEVLEEALQNESQDDLEEIKRFIICGLNARSSVRICDYKNYNSWHNSINTRAKSQIDYNPYISYYLKDYFHIYL